MPLIYSGQENPNTKRLQFFDKDHIEWSDPVQLHDLYKTLFELRKRNEAITTGETFILPSEYSNQLMAFLRRKEEQVVLVLLNVSSEDRVKIRVNHNWLHGTFKNIFSKMQFTFNGEESFELQANEYMVYEKLMNIE